MAVGRTVLRLLAVYHLCSLRAAEGQQLRGSGRRRRPSSSGSAAADVPVVPFNCAAHPEPLQMVETASGFEVRELSIDHDGSYNRLYTIPFRSTSPSFDLINACGIEPNDHILYCVVRIPDRGSFLARIDESRIEFAAKLPVWTVTASFSPTGHYFFMASDGVYQVEDVQQLPGFELWNDAALTDLTNLQPQQITDFRRGADIAVVEADWEGTGVHEYMVSFRGSYVYVHRDAQQWVLSPKVTYPWGDTLPVGGWGAAWNYQGQMYFANNQGYGIFQVDPSAVDLSAGTVDVYWVGRSVGTNSNDGMNCMDAPPPVFEVTFTTTTTTHTTTLTSETVASTTTATTVTSTSTATTTTATTTTRTATTVSMTSMTTTKSHTTVTTVTTVTSTSTASSTTVTKTSGTTVSATTLTTTETFTTGTTVTSMTSMTTTETHTTVTTVTTVSATSLTETETFTTAITKTTASTATTSTTLAGFQTAETGEERTCVVWGDPHVYTFDGDHHHHVDVMERGDFWLVNSELISIQARTWNSFAAQGSSLRALMVSGSFIGGHRLLIEAMDGRVLWDDQQILQEMPSHFEVPVVSADFSVDLISADFSVEGGPFEGQRIDSSRELAFLPLKNLHVRLPLGVKLTVNRWPHHIDIEITMPKPTTPQDGICGNFNGDPTDDTAEMMSARGAVSQVATEELLFPSSNFEYVGCFHDMTEDRDLPFLKSRYSLNDCALACGGFSYFGRQFNGECWCGDSFGKHGQAADEECACDGGDDIGLDRNCIYRYGGDHALPVTQEEKQVTLADCLPERRSLADELCSTGNSACIFDICFEGYISTNEQDVTTTAGR